MTKEKRILVFVVTMAGLGLVFLATKNGLHIAPEISVIVFSSLIMLSFTALFVEHFLTTPGDVLANTVSVLLAISPIRYDLLAWGNWFWIFFGYNLTFLVTSLISLLLANKALSENSTQNRIAQFLKKVSVFFGNGRFLYFGLFALSLLFYVDSHSIEFLLLFGYSLVILILDPKKFVLGLYDFTKNKKLDIGEIIGVQSKNVFLAKLYSGSVPVSRFDVVEFQYTMSDDRKTQHGLVIDKHLLNQEQWIKILVDDSLSLKTTMTNGDLKGNIVYKLSLPEEPEILKRYIGVIMERSTIDKVRFEFQSRVTVEQGTLIELYANGNKVLYQIVQGVTDTENLESKNKTSYVVGEAIQLGLWDSGKNAFTKYGWVPNINTPVYLASDIDIPNMPETEFQIGKIPSSNYPVLVNLQEAISHHLAILGVTGCGKSMLARHLIRTIANEGVKVICVDFTNEYKDKFSDFDFTSIVSKDTKETLFASIGELSKELSKFENQQLQATITKHENILHNNFLDAIKGFLESDRRLSLFELPDVSNSSDILEYTKWFFKILFEIARLHNNYGKKICVVIEEAHTVIPEFTFFGINDKKAAPVVNSIGQIALQGRKYGIGLIVIAQRTANVSKTVLTQCNSVIAFQQFDKTSSEFLSHYLGAEMISSLPTLKFRQAIAVGKGFRTGMPVILEVDEIKEPTKVDVAQTAT